MATAFSRQHHSNLTDSINRISALSQDTQETAHLSFLDDVLHGLNNPQKHLSPKYFYDKLGSMYFNEICQLPEYYPYQTELDLLPEVAQDLSSLLNDEYAIIEFGAGSLKKIQPLFTHINKVQRFLPIDISGEHLRASTLELQQLFPNINMQAIEADFTQPVQLPTIQERMLGFFPGSTIGNFTPEQAKDFLHCARVTLGEKAHLIIGVDTKKSPELLHRAYNDNQGVTKRFNVNILERINRELNGNFNLNNFEHYAYYNPVKGCIEMHLVSIIDQDVNIAHEIFSFSCGESIHTESSFKYTPNEFDHLAHCAGWQVEKLWLAKDHMFSTFLLRAQ